MLFKQIGKKVLLTAVMSAMLLLGACQSDTTDSTKEAIVTGPRKENTQSDNNTGREENTQEEDGAAGTATRVIHMEYGDIKIPASPQRVVVAFFQGDLLALGVKPVGTSFNDDAIFAEELKDVTVIDAFGLNPEAVMALEPDLIIWNNPEEYEVLSKIAPTIAMNFYNGMTYEQRLSFFGEVFGLEEKAEQLINDFKVKVEKAKETLSTKGLTDKNVILLENQQQGVLRVFGDNYGRGGEIIYQYLGLPAPDRIQKEVIDKEDTSFIDIGYEMLNQYVGDFIFSNENIVELSGDSVWASLPAVKEGRLIIASSGMFWYSDITSMNAQLDYIVEALVETVK